MTYDVSEAALLKVLLHAAKHPTTAVAGVLLGAADGGAKLRATDAVPICHSFITLTPVLEAALSQVEQHCGAAGGGLRIVGYYQCNERLGDGELGAGRKVADRLEAAAPDSVAAVLDSTALQAALQQAAQGGASGAAPGPLLQLFAKDGGRWVKVPAGSVTCPATPATAAKLTQLAGEGRHQGLSDFEDHLDNIAADWLNPKLLL